MSTLRPAASVKEEIHASLFSKGDEEYISHVKIWEEDETGRKPRYLILAGESDAELLTALQGAGRDAASRGRPTGCGRAFSLQLACFRCSCDMPRLMYLVSRSLRGARSSSLQHSGLTRPDPSSSAATQGGRCVIHKAKRNSNNTFSKGKTWNLEDLRQLEVVDVSSPSHGHTYPAGILSNLIRSLLVPQTRHFHFTMSKTYRYETEREGEQAVFIEATVGVCRKYMRSRMPKLIGFQARPNGLLAPGEPMASSTPSSRPSG